jgi:hypothetical protein
VSATIPRVHLAGATGNVFYQPDNLAIESGPSRALGLWFGYPAEFGQLMAYSMRSDYIWGRPG